MLWCNLTINPLFAKLVRSSWQDIDLLFFIFLSFFFFLLFMYRDEEKKTKKEIGQYLAILTSWTTTHICSETVIYYDFLNRPGFDNCWFLCILLLFLEHCHHRLLSSLVSFLQSIFWVEKEGGGFRSYQTSKIHHYP